MHNPLLDDDAGHPASSGGVFHHIERIIAQLTAWIAAVLVLVETGVLFAGVIARYVYRKPLVWSDELASILFLWSVSYTHLTLPTILLV